MQLLPGRAFVPQPEPYNYVGRYYAEHAVSPGHHFLLHPAVVSRETLAYPQFQDKAITITGGLQDCHFSADK